MSYRAKVDLIAANEKIAALQEKLEEAAILLRQVNDGMACQPGYVRSVTSNVIGAFLRKHEACQ